MTISRYWKIALSFGFGTMLSGGLPLPVAAVPITTVTVTSAYRVPDSLDLRGTAVAPESDLVSCAKDDRKSLQPDLDAITSLIARAGGKRTAPPNFNPGPPVTTPDGLVLSLASTQNGSYVVTIDSSHTIANPERYFDACLKMGLGTTDALSKLQLPVPRVNSGMAQYSAALGFYLYVQQYP